MKLEPRFPLGRNYREVMESPCTFMILTETVRSLISDTNLRAKMTERVRYLIVDEYQALLQPPAIPLDHLTSGLYNPLTAAEIVRHRDTVDTWVSVSKADNIRDITAIPLVNRLIVVADHTKFSTEIVKQSNKTFL
jgi:hypothetical protein